MSMKPPRPQKMAVSLLLFSFALLVGGCFPFIFPFSQRVSTSTPVQPTSQVATLRPCHYWWARHEVAGLIEHLQNGFIQAGAEHVRVTDAYEYGEDCIDDESNQVVGFSAMDTTMHLEVTVDIIQDQTILREAIARIVIILRDMPRGAPSHAGFGQLNLRFVSPTDSLNMVCYYDVALPVVERGADEDPCPNPFAP